MSPLQDPMTLCRFLLPVLILSMGWKRNQFYRPTRSFSTFSLCMHVFMYMGAACMCVCMWRAKADSAIILDCVSGLFIEARRLPQTRHSLITVVSLASLLRESPLSLPRLESNRPPHLTGICTCWEYKLVVTLAWQVPNCW